MGQVFFLYESRLFSFCDRLPPNLMKHKPKKSNAKKSKQYPFHIYLSLCLLPIPFSFSFLAYQDLLVLCRLENPTGSLVVVFVVSISMSEEVEILFVAEDYASELYLLKSHCCRDPCAGAQIRAGHPLQTHARSMLNIICLTSCLFTCNYIY